MRKYLILLLIACFSFVSCFNEIKKNTNDKDSYITLVFNNPKIKDTLFYKGKPYSIIENQISYCEDNSFIHKVLDITNESKTIRIKTSKPIFLRHLYYINNTYFSDYVFYPNDTLTFEYKNGIPFVKSNKNKNYDLNHKSFFNKKNRLANEDILYFNINNKFKDENELRKDSILVKKIETKQLSFYDSLKKVGKINELDYNSNILYIKYTTFLDQAEPIKILKEHYNLAIEGYKSLINSAFMKYSNLKYTKGKLPNFKDYFNKAVSLKDIDDNNRDYLMFNFLENLITLGLKEDFLACFNVFENEVHNKSLLIFFRDKYPSIITTKENENKEVLLFDKDKNKTSLKNILKRNKGKVIYVDFWASWCAPCRALLPSSKKLDEEYKNKGVVFIYISTDTEIEKWIKTNEKEKLSNSINSYLAINYPEGNLFQELQLKNIPRYIIFDKKGILVNSNAPKPDSKEVKIEFNKYLEE
ncbi:TlpA family protein disulfide reductase [Flavobacterium sp.]|jgi:thiol-disulfide isomerase/thioredoxin|uniref:TlpA family protein disulfide reductase n=1 Tax=Flavobacterium sp. TaxID=239 RepID=UPI0037BF6F2F